MSKAGNFEISVASPYPCWCDISYKEESLARFSHKELSDLWYVVQKAMQEARIKLQDDSGEV